MGNVDKTLIVLIYPILRINLGKVFQQTVSDLTNYNQAN